MPSLMNSEISLKKNKWAVKWIGISALSVRKFEFVVFKIIIKQFWTTVYEGRLQPTPIFAGKINSRLFPRAHAFPVNEI